MRVLMGVDGSSGSLAAVQFASRLLDAAKDEVIFYYSPPHVQAAAGDVSEDALQDFLASAVFDKTRQQMPSKLQSKAQTIVGAKEARQGLLIAADEIRADVIVIGARGTGRLTQPSVGSVARHVVHHATVPVLLVRGPIGSTTPIHVLLASDGSDLCRHASQLLSRFSWPAGTTGHTLTVVENAGQNGIPDWLEEQLSEQQLAALEIGHFARSEEEEARVRQSLVDWCGELPPIFTGCDPQVAAGRPQEQIMRAIDAHRIDLVVVGARRLGAVRRFFLGSTSEFLLHHAPCSLLIVRGHEQS